MKKITLVLSALVAFTAFNVFADDAMPAHDAAMPAAGNTTMEKTEKSHDMDGNMKTKHKMKMKKKHMDGSTDTTKTESTTKSE